MNRILLATYISLLIGYIEVYWAIVWRIHWLSILTPYFKLLYYLSHMQSFRNLDGEKLRNSVTEKYQKLNELLYLFFSLWCLLLLCSLILVVWLTNYDDDKKTFVFDNGFHLVADVFAPVRNGDVEAVITTDFGVCPLAPSVVRRQQRLALGRNHKVDCNIATVTAQSGLSLTPARVIGVSPQMDKSKKQKQLKIPRVSSPVTTSNCSTPAGEISQTRKCINAQNHA